MSDISEREVSEVWQRLVEEAAASGYHVNPDETFGKDLVRGLLENEGRYGYRSCPCRLASGIRSQDLDIICPCDYRDADLEEFGVCYCALYVSPEVGRGDKPAVSIPDHRPVGGPKLHTGELERIDVHGLGFPVWRCRVCGYLCARPEPPLVCPVCKATKDRFERFI